MRTEVLWVLGVLEQVEYRPPPPEADAVGYVYPDKPLILISPKNAHDETALHELVHRLSNRLLENELDEQQVQALSSGLFSVLRDPRNAWFTKYLAGEEARGPRL